MPPKPSSTEKTQAKSNGHSSNDVDGSKNDWKFRAPYKIHNKEGDDGNGADFNAIYEGECHCGRVKFQLSRERPLEAKFCHCSTCRVLHGAPFQHAAIFHKEDINFTHGHHDLAWYDSGSKTTAHKLPCKVSCAYCRAPIMDEGRRMILLFPGALKLSKEEMERFRPTCHMFYGERVVDINDGLPKWEGMQKKSKLIADSPVEEVRKRKREEEEEEKEEEEKEKEEKKEEKEADDMDEDDENDEDEKKKNGKDGK